MQDTLTLPTQNLPPWMRRALRPIDWGALLTLAFSLLIITPMLFSPGLPRTNDNERWVYQAANYARAFREGRLYPRWVPHALGGYGSPIPHYYPPIPAYSAGVAETMFTGQSVEAVRLIYLVSIALSGLPVYALAARHKNARSGLIAALLYTASPYINFVTPMLLGDLPAVLGHLMLPFLLWAFDRLLVANQPFDLAWTTLGLAALILTDLRYLLLAALFMGTVLLQHWSGWRKVALFSGLASVALALALAAFFWLPAALEYDAVQWRIVTEPLPTPVSLASVFQTLEQIDPAETVPAPQHTVGSAIPLLSGLGVLALLLRKGTFLDRLWMIVGSLCLALAALLNQGWLLGGAVLGLSVGAGACTDILAYFRTRTRNIALSLMVTLIMFSALPIWLTPRPAEIAIDTSGAAQLQYELQGFGVAGLPAGWRLPTTLASEIAYSPWLLASYNSGEIEKVDPQTIPSGVQVGFLAHDSHSDRLQIQSDFSNSIVILTAAFPGWSASATSAEVRLERAPDSGLLNLKFPDGINSDITLALGSTPARTVAWAISGFALVVLAVLTRRRRSNSPDYLADYALIRRNELLGVSVVWLVFALLIALALSGALRGLQTLPGSGLENSNPLRIATDAGVEVVAYREARTGSDVEIVLYWRALTALDRNLRLQITLVDPTTGAILIQSHIQHPGGYPTRRWLSTRYVTDYHGFQLPPGTETLPVAARVELYDCAEVCIPQDRITFFDAQGSPIGQVLTLPIAS